MNWIEERVRCFVQHYNHNGYWKLRERVTNPNNHYPRILKQFWLFYIKKCDTFNNASMGTHNGYGAVFAEPPILPHGLYGIIISHNAKIGKNCVIFHQVTIGDGRGGHRLLETMCI